MFFVFQVNNLSIRFISLIKTLLLKVKLFNDMYEPFKHKYMESVKDYYNEVRNKSQKIEHGH